MLDALGYDSLDALMDTAVPKAIRLEGDTLDLPGPLSEDGVAKELRAIADANRPGESMIGLGYHGTLTPPVIRRNVLEDPSWYTAYTPYQPEISQGRLEALLNFQTVVSDLAGLPTANSSLLDEATAAAEAMTLVRACQPQGDRSVRRRRRRAAADDRRAAHPRGGDGHRGASSPTWATGLPDGELSGVLLQYPGASGRIRDPRPVIEEAHARNALAVVAADLLALTLLEAPGTLGADVVVGSSQRFGVPLFYGGPHAGFMAVGAGLERHLPGRLVGVSVDAEGRPAYRLALQTREQHIRRDKATSNICTAQVLLAVVASMYAVYHGPDGLRAIARRAHGYAVRIADALRARRLRPPRRALLRHPHGAGPRPGRRDRGGRAEPRPPAAPRRRRHGGALDLGDDHLVHGGLGAAGLRRGPRGLDRGVRRRGRRPAPGPAAQHRLPHPPGVPRAPQRDPAAALPAPPLRPRLRARPRDDPARLVHHEAQRHDRDGAGEPDRLRRPAPVRPGGGRRGLPQARRRPRGLAGRGHRLRPGLDPAQRRLAG